MIDKQKTRKQAEEYVTYKNVTTT